MIRVLLRVFAALATVGGVSQAILAGRFLSGDVDRILDHRVGGIVTSVLLFAYTVVAVVARIRRGPTWPLAIGAVLTAASAAQVHLGFIRNLGLHVPLGVVIVVGLVMLTHRTFRLAA